MRKIFTLITMSFFTLALSAQNGTQPDSARVIVGSEVVRTIDVLPNDNLNASKDYELSSVYKQTPGQNIDIAVSNGKVTYKDNQGSASNDTFFYVVRDKVSGLLDTNYVVVRKSDLLLDQYPGDANKDNICNHIDFLNIGVAFGKTNMEREGNYKTSSWLPIRAYDWPTSSVVSNNRYADLDGDGQINLDDKIVIETNYGLTSNTPNIQYSPTGGSTYQLIGSDSFLINGSQNSYTLNINLNNVSKAYGMAFSIKYDTALFKPSDFSLINGQWYSDIANVISYFHPNHSKGEIEVSLVRQNGLNGSGDGGVCSIEVIIDDILGGLANIPTGFQILNTVLIDSVYNLLPVSASTVKPVVIHKSTSSIKTISPKDITVYFSQENLIIKNQSNKQLENIGIYNILGSKVASISNIPSNKEKSLDVSLWSKGIYFIQSEGVSKKILFK